MSYSFLVATDVDSTLLVPGQPVSDANKAAINKVRELGGAFTLATGRTSLLTGAYILDLNLDVPLISSNGAAIYDPTSRKELYSSLIPEEIIRKFIEIIFKNKVNAVCYSADAIYFTPGSTRKDFIENYNATLPEDFKAPLKALTPDMITGNTPKLNKFLFIDPDKESWDFACTFDELELVSSGPGFYDIMYKGSTKGSGLLRVADILGISHDMTFALGDSDNDLSMLTSAKYGIAMGNANSLIKENAAYITDSCENDGFAKALLEYVIPTVLNQQK